MRVDSFTQGCAIFDYLPRFLLPERTSAAAAVAAYSIFLSRRLKSGFFFHNFLASEGRDRNVSPLRFSIFSLKPARAHKLSKQS